MGIMAELKGKISSSGTNLTTSLEDLLTSNVFQLLRYLPNNTLLNCILEATKALESDKLPMPSYESVDYIFWPKHNKTEPDVQINFKKKDNIVVCMFIEVKYRSPQSHKQLHRQWFDLVAYAKEKDAKKRYLVYLTQDWVMPEEEFRESEKSIRSELRKKHKCKGKEDVSIYWLSWRDIHLCVKDQFDKATESAAATILKDIKMLLEKKRLTGFYGYNWKNEEALQDIVYFTRFKGYGQSLLQPKRAIEYYKSGVDSP